MVEQLHSELLIIACPEHTRKVSLCSLLIHFFSPGWNLLTRKFRNANFITMNYFKTWKKIDFYCEEMPHQSEKEALHCSHSLMMAWWTQQFPVREPSSPMGHVQQLCDLWLCTLTLASPAPADKSTHKSLNGSLSQQYDSFSLPGRKKKWWASSACTHGCPSIEQIECMREWSLV